MCVAHAVRLMCVFYIIPCSPGYIEVTKYIYIIPCNPGYIKVTRYIHMILPRNNEINSKTNKLNIQSNYKYMFTKGGQKLTSILKFNCELFK